MKEITETEQIALGKYRRSGWCIQFRCIRTPFHWLLNGAGTIACGTTSRYNLDAIGLCRSDQSAIIQLVSLFFLPLLWFTLFHSSPHIRFHHFHQSMQPFPRDNSSVFGYLSSIWPFFLRRSFQVFFFHSFIRFILQNLPIWFATIYIFCPHEHIHVHILRGISIFGENQYYVSMWFVTILNKVWTWTPDFQ